MVYSSMLNQNSSALKYTKEDGTEGVLDGLLVPSSVLQHFQVSAQAGSSSHL